MNTRINIMEQYLIDKLNNESTGHDYYHALRVAKLAMNICLIEGGDKEIIYVASLIHDLIDHKLFSDLALERIELVNKLTEASFTDVEIDQIMNIIENISFSQGKIPTSLAGKIVQDADRLDALGAIGIARTFAYGGKMNRMIYDENKLNKSQSIQHFYDKLLKLKDLMHTSYAKDIAVKRTKFMEDYLIQFFDEWNVTNL